MQTSKLKTRRKTQKIRTKQRNNNTNPRNSRQTRKENVPYLFKDFKPLNQTNTPYNSDKTNTKNKTQANQLKFPKLNKIKKKTTPKTTKADPK